MQQSMQTFWSSSLLDGGNAAYIEEIYEQYLADREQVASTWQAYFDSLPQVNGNVTDIQHSLIKEHFKRLTRQPRRQVGEATTSNISHELKQLAVQDLIHEYRLLGHLYSTVDPLELKEKQTIPELELRHFNLSISDLKTTFNCGNFVGPEQRTLEDILKDLTTIYCGNVASEFMHIPDTMERLWVQKKIEHTLTERNIDLKTRTHILEGLIAADGLEKYLGTKYPGAKRFGLEGCDSLIVALDEMIQQGGKEGIEEVVIGMAHRGRLNVLVNILGKSPSELFDEFEGKHNFEVESGDVKYHQGFSSDVATLGGNVHLSLAFNPSHLEIVTPVAAGSVRARQERRLDKGDEKVLPIAIHGDAAFAGQGVVMETLNMSQTRGYSIGGTIHIIINNQVGFTTSNLKDARSTLYCSDLGKMISAPIFHVNADDPEGLYCIVQIALEYRKTFKKDVIINLVGYRRHGHNEADEPRATQPVMYQKIAQRPPVRQLYADYLIRHCGFEQSKIEQMVDEYRKSLDERDRKVARNLIVDGWKRVYATDWTNYDVKDWRYKAPTPISIETLKQITEKRDGIPKGFILNSRVKKIIEDRHKMTHGELKCDWGYAETLAYGSLLLEGYAVRLSGQDCGRGTFFHRHAVWHDQKTGESYTSLCHLAPGQAKFTVIDSLLSEAAVLGFEYGFSTSEPRALVIWEAQFGDFANGAQVVIDQFISSGEQKWGRLSGLTMLLPHGYEGQGPEHSSARLERYLQLCAQHNIQVCIPSTPAQVFHMLRRQILRPIRKPLIVMSPKSLLRHKEAVSTLDELTSGQFYPILEDTRVNQKHVKRVILCSGKVYYELDEKRQEDKRDDVAIIRIEQLYPFPETELKVQLDKYKQARDVVWCQEEPLNQGAWYSSQHHMRACLQSEQRLHYAGREASAAPAAGYMHLHLKQQKQLVNDAFK